MTTVYLAPTFGVGYQGFTTGGLPLNAGKIYTYQAGSTTPQATYTTSAGTVQNANPIVLSADGRPSTEIWLVSGQSYRFDLKDSNDNLIKTYDNISGINDVLNQYIASIVTVGNAVSSTGTGNYFDVTSIVLTAGDWDVSVVGAMELNSATGCTFTQFGASTTPGNDSSGLGNGDTKVEGGPATTAYDAILSVPAMRFSLSVTTTVYLKARGDYSGGPIKGYGRISARCVR